MTDKKEALQDKPADQQVPASATSVAELAAALQRNFDEIMKGRKSQALAAALRAHGKAQS